MSFSRFTFLALGLSLLPAAAFSQDIGALDTADLAVPVKGVNFSLDFTTQHNSSTGWSNILTPDLSYRFNRHLAFSALTPWYLSTKDYIPTVAANGNVTYNLLSARSLLADTIIAGELELDHNDFNYSANVSMGLPTGNSRFGLSANQVTYNVTNHFDYNIGPFDPDIEIGEGDNSGLSGQPVKKAYVAVGPIANFQAGTSIDLPFKTSLDLEAYENLPIGNQNVYGTVTKVNKKGKSTKTSVLQGTGAAEDNGFTAELDIPLGTHFIFAGTYERSLIQGLDTVSAGITWNLRRPTILKRTAQ